MEIYEHDKSHKAYYVFPYTTRIIDALGKVARKTHVSRGSFDAKIGRVKGNELFLEPTKGGKKVVVVYRARK